MYYEKYLQVIFVNFWVLIYGDDYVIDFGAIHAHILNRKFVQYLWARANFVSSSDTMYDFEPCNNNTF